MFHGRCFVTYRPHRAYRRDLSRNGSATALLSRARKRLVKPKQGQTVRTDSELLSFPPQAGLLVGSAASAAFCWTSIAV